MTHLQIIQSLQEYKQQRPNLPLPHAVKLTEENYVILCDILKYTQFYIIDGKTGNHVDSSTNDIKILIDDVEQEYSVNNNLYTLINITNQDYNFANTFEITVLSNNDNYKQSILTTTPNRVNNTNIPLFEQTNSDQIYMNWSHTYDEYAGGYDIDTHAVIYGPKNGSDTEYERKGEVTYSQAKRYFIDDNILVLLDIDDTGGANGETITIQHITDLAEKYIIYYVQYDYSNYKYTNSTVFIKRNARVVFRSKDSNGEFVEIVPIENGSTGRYWKVLAVKNHEILDQPNVIGDNNDLTSNWHLFTSLRNSDTDSIYTSGYNSGYNDYGKEEDLTTNPHNEQDNPNSYYSWNCGYTHGSIMAAATQTVANLGYNSDHYDLSAYDINEQHVIYNTYASSYTYGWLNKLQDIIEENVIANTAHRNDVNPEEINLDGLLIPSDYTDIYIRSLSKDNTIEKMYNDIYSSSTGKEIENILPIIYDMAWYNKIDVMAGNAARSDFGYGATTAEDVGLDENDYANVIYGWGETADNIALVCENAWTRAYDIHWESKGISGTPSLLPPINRTDWFDRVTIDSSLVVDKKEEFGDIEMERK